jgi:hypothetical protein
MPGTCEHVHGIQAIAQGSQRSQIDHHVRKCAHFVQFPLQSVRRLQCSRGAAEMWRRSQHDEQHVVHEQHALKAAASLQHLRQPGHEATACGCC